jgi:hypothetical protein
MARKNNDVFAPEAAKDGLPLISAEREFVATHAEAKGPVPEVCPIHIGSIVVGIMSLP